MINIVEDVSNVTTIPTKVLEKLFTTFIYCVSDAVYEAKKQDKDVVDVDIGLGTLSLKLTEESVTYKFIPSEEFQEALKSTILDERNLLESKLEQTFINKVTNLYKELI